MKLKALIGFDEFTSVTSNESEAVKNWGSSVWLHLQKSYRQQSRRYVLDLFMKPAMNETWSRKPIS